MTDSTDTIRAIARARGDVAAQRTCLRCKADFWSDGFGERICSRCKGTVAWRSAAPGASGQGRHRPAGRSK